MLCFIQNILNLNDFQSWDNELAGFAEMNAKTCIFAHDKCRNTGKTETVKQYHSDAQYLILLLSTTKF